MTTANQNLNYRMSLALLGSVSALALAQPATAQEDETTSAESDTVTMDTIVISGIKESLTASSEIKRNAQGVIDAISAEDMGKFPDTNLAESLQRITGVSIDRQNGEGTQVTVRGFGPAFNLVLLNGRQMPTALLEGGAPASRSFDFGNLASEGIAGVDVYKSGRADLPTGGIGSTLNIKTARPLDAPGQRYSVGVKGVMDNSVTSIGSASMTPEISGIYSNTFADDKFGIAVAGSYQERNSGYAQFGTTSGWRGAYRGDENNWGTLPQPPGDTQVTNRPGATDIYSTPQNGNYSLTDVNRERINGQLALQYAPTERIEATLDYFYSQNKVATDRSDLSVWFNHGDVTSAWGDGPIADPLFYNENFASTDLSMGAARYASKAESKSLGFNLAWQATDNLSFEFDAHNSSAENGSDSPFGTSSVLSTADLTLNYQGLDFTTELPTLSIGFPDGTDNIDASRMRGTGSTFQDSNIRTEIDQYQLFAKYEFNEAIVDSVDFGIASTTNNYRSTFSNNQRDSWGGVGNPEDYPDDIWKRVNLAGNFDQFSGAGATYPAFFAVNFDKLLAAMDASIGGFDAVCGGNGNCIDDTPLLNDRRTEEKSFSAFLQVNMDFDLGSVPTKINGGVRYEKTDVTSEALVGFPTGTAWVAENEFSLLGLNDIANRDFTRLEGDYDYILPAIDMQIEPRDGLILRAAYSHTMTRPSYADIQGGQTVAQLFRVDGGEGNSGNPALLPFLSKNIDLSAEWYYDQGSYFSIGYFNKEVNNFIGTQVFTDTPFEVYTPVGGARYNAAVAALGTTDATAIRQWIFANSDPTTFEITGTDANGNPVGNIFGVPGEDPLVSFDISRPINQDTKKVDGLEFAWQHFLGDTGFGWILNYTMVNGDVKFDNFSVPADGIIQTPLIGLSDSYNVVAFYDNYGFQARLAYNWRDKFLTSATGVSGAPNNPQYVEDYGQLDFNASYDVTDHLSLFVEGINILDETSRTVGRSSGYVNFATQTGSRYNIGARYSF